MHNNLKKTQIKLSALILTLLMLTAISGCSMFKNYNNTADTDMAFDTNPNHYKKAKLAANTTVPEYIAKNIERQSLYPVPSQQGLAGDLTITAVPPSLSGKIVEY